MFLARIRSLIERLTTQEQSPKKLALSCCVGIYIGLSPLIGLHTVVTLLFGWIFALNMAAVFAMSILIHNPWTMVPIYAFNHFVGTIFFKFFGIDGVQLDPAWFESCSLFLKQHTGISGLSLSAFFVGGNLLGITISVMLYPLIKRAFAIHLSKKHGIKKYDGGQPVIINEQNIV